MAYKCSNCGKESEMKENCCDMEMVEKTEGAAPETTPEANAETSEGASETPAM